MQKRMGIQLTIGINQLMLMYIVYNSEKISIGMR
jgi:hypothetical protein